MSIILDAETLAKPVDEILSLLGPFDPDKVSVPKNYKVKATIEAFIEEARENHGKDVIDRAALDPRYSTVAIVGILRVDNKGKPGELIQLTGDEKEMLTEMWKIIGGNFIDSSMMQTTFGYGIKSFDVPYLVKRSWVHRIKVPSQCVRINNRWPIDESFIDLSECFSLGKKEYVSLDTALSFLGLPDKNGTGKEFGALWSSDKPAALKYNETDLRLELSLAQAIGAIPI